jgi:hypothetical protein
MSCDNRASDEASEHQQHRRGSKADQAREVCPTESIWRSFFCSSVQTIADKGKKKSENAEK